MQAANAGHLLGRQRSAGLPQEGVDEQSAAHADATVNAPHRQLDPGRFQRFPPREHMLVDAVHQRAIEIEQEGWTRSALVFGWLTLGGGA